MELVSDYPSPAYWKNLIEIVASEAGRSDRMSLEIFRLKLAAGVLDTSSDYTEMAQLAIQLGLPGEAESIIGKGFAAKILGGANKSREERLLNMAKTQAGQDEPTLGQTGATPKAKAALAEAYASYGRIDKAIALYRDALANSFAEADLARLHLGQALLVKDDKKGALAAFESVKEPKLRSIAQLWIAIVR
jgi:tetratricopeptide (TPR) repeat protein